MEEFRIVLADACKIVKESSRKRVISGADEDGRVMVEFSEPVSGRVVKSLTPEEINGMLYKEETAENPADMTKENPPGEQDTGQERGTTEESALERIPKDAQTGEPQYTQTDADTAWDVIVEQTEGDEDMARSVVDSTVRDKEAALKKLESSNPKPGATVAEKIAAAKEHKAAIEAARQELEQWQAIAEVENSRKAEAEAKAKAEEEEAKAKAKAEEERTALKGVNLSEEKDENGNSFVVSSDGTTTFGEVRDKSGLPAAPIKLSVGYQDKNGSGYGLTHIEANHGAQIKKEGFASVEDFVSYVAKNYDENNIKVGKRRTGGSITYLLQVTGKHDNTLFIELSRDGSYWNVNSAGVFRKGYSDKKETVAKTEPQQPSNAISERALQSADQSNGILPASPNGKPTVSTSKVSESPETKQEKAEKSISAKVKEASADVNTEPTEAQKEAGNYKKGRVQVGAFDITIEQPEGSIRRGTDADGKQWESKMHNTYGYIRGTEGVDGDHIDVFLSNDMDGWNGAQVFVVDQYNPDGTFDEHKVMLGFNDASDAKNNYLANYEKGWENGRRIDVSAVSLEDFEKWIASSHRKTKPFSEYKSVKPADDSETFKGHKAENSGKDTEAQIKHLEEIKDYPGADKKIVQSEIDRLKAKEEAKAKSKSEEAKSKSKEVKSKSEEAKSKSEEAKSKSEEAKSKSEEAKSKSEEVKSKSEEAKSKSEEVKSKSEEVKSKSEEKNGVDDAKIDAVLEALSKGDEKAARRLASKLTNKELSKARSKAKPSFLLEYEWQWRAQNRGDVSLHDWMLENQYAEPVKRVSGTFKMTDYIAPKDSPYAERIGGVYHDKSGFAVATDGRILVADKGSYDPKLKGKIIGKDGAAMENKFPDWQEAISTAKETKSSLIDVEDLHRFVAGVLRANKRAYISLRFPDGTVGVFKANRLNLTLRAMKQLGTSELLYTKDGMILVAKSEKGTAMLMGLVSVEDELVEANGYAYPGNTVSMGKVSESPETKQEKDEKSAEDSQNKITDVGEKISGARKDLLRDFSNKLKDTTLESLITLPFSKAFKRPDLKTAVEQGLLRQRDARFAEAVMATYLSKNKPRLLSGWKKGESQKNLEAWAKDAYFGVQTLRALFEADETTRDKLIDEILSAKAYREDDIDRRKKQLEEWNPGKKFEGKCYPLNPVAVYMAVYERLGYDNIGEFKLPVSGVGSSTFFDHYELTDNSGKKIYPTRALQSFEDVVDEITYLSKVKNADEDTDHPSSIFRLAGINPVWESTGWRVLTLGTSSSKRPETHLFKTKEEAEKFAEEYKAGGKYRQASTPIENKELIGYGNYELKFHLGEKDISTGLTFSSKEDARAAIDTEHEKLNAIVNEKLAKARESGGKNEKRPQKDYVRIQAYTEDGKAWKYAVVLDERYAPKSTALNTLPYSLANGFSTRKEAVAYIEKHRVEWDAKIDDINRRRKDFVFLNGSSERVGEDYRKGEDITAEQFREQFGFRGVQFGNWTNQKDRQAALNNAFDSFMDLAKILGISPRAVSLNGELGIAFGARGGGGAKAHYEREEVVINLTKTMGAGSLAHEWWHALDNYFARRGNVKLGMVTEGKGIAMRGELRKAYDKLVSDTENSDYNRRSRDAGASYWGTRREETARMFAMWVFDEISKKGERNSFLTDNDPAAEERYAKGNYDFYVLMCGQDRAPMTFEEFRKSPSALAGYVYPSQQELEEFGADLRKIFDTVQERVDEETGNTVLYHRGEVVSEMSQEERVLRDAVIDRLRENGMEVITDEEAGQRVLDEANGKAKLSAKKRRALETVSASHDEKHQPTVVSSADGAKILKELDDTKEKYENLSNRINTFIGDVAKALGAKRGGSASEYASFETKNGKIITIRLSNHNAKVSNFDANGETDGISIVVSPKKSEGMTNDGKAHVVEYYYDAIKLRRAEGKPLADIVRSIKQALYSGEFEDTTGLAERQEVNAEITDRVRFFRTAKGEAYGFTVGGKIYIDPKIANTETPIHEYAHLWAAALRGQNPKEWQNIVELMKGTSVWDEVKKRYPELNTDDDIADEVLATYSGRRGAERLREEQRKIAGDKGSVFEKAEAISALERVKQALRKFWKSVADFLHIHYKSAEEVADRVMKDLLDGVDPRKHFNSRMDESKSERIEKLRESKPVEITGEEITPSDDLKQYKRNALEYGKKLRGVYTNEDTGEQIELTGGNRRGGLREILQHDYKDKEHLQSIAAIPQIIEKAIFIDELPNEDRKNYPGVRAFRYYVCGLKIADVDYTVKAVIAEQNNGERYYDHKLTKIEKGKLLSIIPTIQKAGMDSDLPRSVGKDSRLLSILQVKDEKKPNDGLYRVGGGKELRDGRKIEFVRKPTATYNALARHLQAEGIKPDMHEARTGSRYMSFEKDGVQWEVRSSDHTKPEYYGEAQKPVELTYYKDKQGEENLSVSVDLGTSGYNIEDMKALMAEIDRLKNDAGEVKESFDRGVASNEVVERYPLLSQALGVKSENEVRAKEEAREHAEEARKQEMRSAVEDMAGRLHLNNVDIVDKPAGRGAGRRERAKGMFERSTGRITINIGNCADKRDAVVTLLHEAVAHHGLRKLFGENFETFLDNVYNSANAEIRRIIDKHSHRYDGDKRTATEEYMASLAERTDFENAKKSGWWQRIKDFFLKMLEKIGLKGFKGEDLSDNELRYVLWRSYENLKSGGKDTVFSAADDLAKQNELKVGEFAPDAKAEGSVAALNTRFNNELQQQIDGNLPSNHIYQMGNPGKILLSTGVPDLPIQMNAKRLQDKTTLFDHNFELYEVKDLVKALQNPLAVFSYGDKTKAQNIIVPLQKNGKNFIVGLSLNPTVGGKALEINSIRNVFPKDNSEWLNWISQGKALYLDKEKIQTLIAQQRTNLADVEYLDLDSAAKVVENFENPKPESKNDILFRDGDAKDYEKAQARETYERRVSTGMFQSREAIQDSMLSLKVAMDAIEEATAGKAKRIEDYDGFENAYLGENRLSSVNQAESAAFAHLLIRPMMEEVNRLAPTAEDRAELIDYMFAKHGLERNAYMRQQAAEKKLAEYKKQNPGTAKTTADFIDAERDYAGLTTLTGEADVSAAEAEAQRMVADYENDYTFHGTWNEIYVCRKKIC